LSSVLHGPGRKKIPVSDKYNPLKNEIFLPIPLKIAQRKDLKNLSKLVYGYLLKCFGKNGLACPKMAVIAKDLNVSRRMISKCITELKTKNLIKICKTGKASRYEFVDDAKILGNSQLPNTENGKIFSYQEYLKSEEWKRIRKKVLIKFDWSCGVCKSKNDLHVHHKTYENIGNELKHLKDLIVLCRNCHSLFHSKLKEGEK
jgi:hypothetical protein